MDDTDYNLKNIKNEYNALSQFLMMNQNTLTRDERNQIRERLSRLEELLEMFKRSAPPGAGVLTRDVGTLPPSTRSLLETDKDKPIKRLTIWRKPIDVNFLLKALKSAGFVNYKHDDLFHLAVNIGYTPTSNDVNLEKTEYIKFYKGGIPSKATQTLDVPIPQNYVSGRPVRGQPQTQSNFTTIGELFEKVRKQMGPNWTEYDVENNNCQDFVANILKALNLDTKENLDFVNQDVKGVLENVGGEFAKAVAGVAVKVKQAQNRLQEGEGHCGCQMGMGDTYEMYNYQMPRCKIQF